METPKKSIPSKKTGANNSEDQSIDSETKRKITDDDDDEDDEDYPITKKKVVEDDDDFDGPLDDLGYETFDNDFDDDDDF